MRDGVPERGREIEKLMTAYEKCGLFSGAVLAAENGKIIYKGAFGLANRELNVANTLDTRFRIASISKPFTATLVLQLEEEGKLSRTGTIKDYLPEYAGPGANLITVHQLLTHTSGIVGEWAVQDLDRIERDFYTRDQLLEHIADYNLWFIPGIRRGYSNFGYFILGVIIERTSGRTYADLLEEKICKPAGMRNTLPEVTQAIIERRSSGYHYIKGKGIENAPPLDMSFVFGYGQLMSTVEDLYLWDCALQAEKLLSPENTRFIIDGASERDPLGSSRTEVPVIRFGGSVNGFLCSTHSFTEDRRFVTVLVNVKDPRGKSLPSTFDVARNIAAILYGLEYDIPGE